MSAINGIFERRDALCSATDLHASHEALNGYGRDGGEILIAGAVGFGHQRTKLFCGAGDENMPHRDDKMSILVTADLRLDNREALAACLGISKFNLEKTTDVQLLTAAWQKWANHCPAHLIGDYAFAIWDERRRALFCARDHCGARPLFYSLTPEKFVFASNIKAVLAVSGISRDLDEDYITAYIGRRCFFSKDRTFFAAVRPVLPGHSLTIKTDGEKLERFWFPERVPAIRLANDAEYIGAAREIYERAIIDRLRTAENVGVHLTGGLDSSSIAVIAARKFKAEKKLRPAMFCWQSPPGENSENNFDYRFIKFICEQENLTPHYCPADSADILSVLKKDAALDQVEGTMMAEIAVQREASANDVRLILSGWGGDETLSFGGSGYHANLLLRGRWLKFWRESRQYHSSARLFAREFALLFSRDYVEGSDKIDNRSWHGDAGADAFLHPELRRNIKLKNIRARRTSVRAALLWYWNWGIHAERMNSWTEHGAPLGVNYAYPMLDRRLMEFVIGLPPEQFIRGKIQRWIMRKVVEDLLPAEIRSNQRKDDPGINGQLNKSLYQAYEQAGREIASAARPPARAKFLDMEKLLETLQPAVLAHHDRPGDLRRALQFLDF